jgi:hypothetical protein
MAKPDAAGLPIVAAQDVVHLEENGRDHRVGAPGSAAIRSLARLAGEGRGEIEGRPRAGTLTILGRQRSIQPPFSDASLSEGSS